MKSKYLSKLLATSFCAILLSLLVLGAYGQTAGGQAPLPQFLFPSFIKSTVLLKDGSIWSANFNYQTVDEEMVFMQNGKYMVPEKPEDIDTIYIQDKPFVPFERAFYEVIRNDKISFYIQHRSKYSSVGTPTAYGMTSQTNAATTGSIARTGNQVRTIEMPENVQVNPSMVYWVKANGKMNKFTTEKQFIKIFPEKESELKEFFKKSQIDIKTPNGIRLLAAFCNT